jgi:SAM-dependent methyltransferase
MKAYGIESYGDSISGSYDEIYADFSPYRGQIEFLHEKAGATRALELGVGTGRIAIPLAQSGIQIMGIDSSEEMLAILADRAKDLPIQTAKADAADFHCRTEPFGLVFGIFNFLFLLPTRAAQLGCFKCVRSALTSNGSFVIETFVPIADTYLPDGANPGFFPQKSGVSVRSISDKHVSLFASVNQSDQKTWRIQEILLSSEQGVRLFPCVMRYLCPAEIDQLTTEAGFVLTERYEDWMKTPFTASSRKHISVYMVNHTSS